jgi:hypothetical protein
MNGDAAMNQDETLNASALALELRDALTDLATPEVPPLAAITSRGRAHRRRRRAGFAGLGVTVAAVGTALAIGLTGALGGSPAQTKDAVQPSAPSHSTGTSPRTIRTAAFILTSNTNGTDTLTLTMTQVLNPASLQQALTQDGIPALVKSGTICSSTPAAPDPLSIGVLSVQPPNGLPHGAVPAPSGPSPSAVQQMAAHTVTVINPAAIPSGTELFFGYSSNNRAVFTDLIYTNSYTCPNSQ